ncbi:OsmC family protein [Actinomyces minihominis]|uniref:OsmC family protein n=1 Tax=Actinomyces minihominis TaxID=2002838 RepID=UPI000C08A76E|nr:OsmC family protein [Actinomyces minihominis]
MATFEVTGVSKSPTHLEVSARQFTLSIDEPPALGGTDEGPNPVEFVLSALLGCLNVVVNVIAKEKGVEIRRMRSKAKGDLNPALFATGTSPDRAGFKGIDVTLEIDSDASAEVIAEIVAEAERRCPVSDNLANVTPVAIGSEVVVSA